MSSFELPIDPREEQYARYVSGVIAMLKDAVSQRVADGVTQTEIAARIDMHKSSLSRILNGRVGNLTARTISDILWATEHEPERPTADPIEEISANYCPIHKRADLPTFYKAATIELNYAFGSGWRGPTKYTAIKSVELVK